MWVKFTRSAYTALLAINSGDELTYAAFSEQVERTPQRVKVLAPYVAWKTGRDRLYRATFGPRGGKRQATQREFSALKSIQTELNYVDSHPAMRNLGMLGWQADIFPVWETGDPDAPWSPYPLPGRRFVILTPDWRDHQLGLPKHTVWEPQPSGEGRLAEEEFHLSLWRDVVRR
jgi:hypothetical protein